jgi:predicted dienelactone hydrolase
MNSIKKRLPILAFVLISGAMLLEPGRAPDQRAYKQAPGPFEVKTACFDWLDEKRERQLPVKVYFPGSGDGLFPLVVFSHGLGGSREGYEYLGRHWASHGYICVHLQHIGSDDAVWREQERPVEAMRRAAAQPRNAVNRAGDVRFAIDEMTRLNKESGAFQGRLDLDNIGLAGHSFGANTTLVIAGQVFILPGGREIEFPDLRIKAAIPMSAPVPRNRDELTRAFRKIAVPCLHMTGTLDDSPIGDTTAADRRLPFDHIDGPDQYLITFEGGDHMIFSGRSRRAAAAAAGHKDALFQDLVRQSTLAFWDAYLKSDERAKSWLAGGGLESMLGRNGRLEMKNILRSEGQVSPAISLQPVESFISCCLWPGEIFI